MAESFLLKFARARDDQEFRWRVAAAMTLLAQQNAESTTLPAEVLFLRDWVLDNPMAPLDRMVTEVATDTKIAANVRLEMGAVDTSDIPDDDIMAVVTARWPRVAAWVYRTNTPAKRE